MTTTEKTEGRMKFLQEFVDFFAGYEMWALIAMGICLVALIVLVVVGRKSPPPVPAEFRFRWDTDPLEWKSPTPVTARYWFILNNLRVSLTETKAAANEAPPTRFRVFRGVTGESTFNHGDVEVLLTSIERDKNTSAPYRPNLTGFVVRDREGFYQLADLDSHRAMPKALYLSSERKIPVPGYTKGERLEIVVFVDMSHRPDKFTAISEIPPEGLFDCQITKSKAEAK